MDLSETLAYFVRKDLKIIMKRKIGFPKNINYRKPFYRIKEGFGYEGVLLVDQDTGEIQCHECGHFFNYLGQHIKEHKLRADEYRLKFGLNADTALCSEKVRNDLVKRGMTFPWERMQKMVKDRIKRNQNWRKGNPRGRNRMEFKNKNGTCTMQLIDRMITLSEQLGRQPHPSEMKSTNGAQLKSTITKSFGSIKKMRSILEQQGYYYPDPRRGWKISDKVLLGSIRSFTKAYGRRPSFSDVKRGLLAHGSMTLFQNRFGSWSKAKQLAYK